MRILVTGGAGFIGSHLVDRLLEQRHEVTVADNFLTGHHANLEHLARHPGLRVVSQDISLPLREELTRDRFERIYNLASPASPRGYSQYPLETMRVNSQGTWHALDLAADHGARFLQASTSEVYGDPMVHPQVEQYWGNVNPVGPRACYDEGKRFAEALVMEHIRQRGIDARIARIFNTYGPRSHPADGRLVPNFCVQAIRGEPITVYGSGEQTRSFCYVNDLVDGLIRLMETDDLSGEIVNLGNPEEHSILDFATRIASLGGSDAGIIRLPLPKDDPQRRQPDIAKATRLLDWRPLTPLDEGLTTTIGFFRERITMPDFATVVSGR